jgi:hypothetical protein
VVDGGLQEAEQAGDRGAQLVGHDAGELLASVTDLAQATLLLARRLQAAQEGEDGEHADDADDAEEQEQRGLERTRQVALEL